MAKKFAIYVEDDPNSCFVMQNTVFKRYFKDFELCVFETSCNFEDYLSALPQIPEFVILDIYLGDCPTGDIIMRWMREQSVYDQTIIVAFTADSKIEGQSLMVAGFDAVIRKPQDDSEFLAGLFQRVLAGERLQV